MHALVPLALLFVLSCQGCDRRGGSPVSSATCIDCRQSRATGALASHEMSEISGLVASTRVAGVFFAHNDSGDSARFFAVDAGGGLQATFAYAPATVLDCEDMARGPCAAGATTSCLYLGDIGDNVHGRDAIVVHRVREPESIADATLAAEPIVLRYPDGPHDAETLLVHPVTATITIVTKERSRPSAIYELPLPSSPGGVHTLRWAGTLESPSGSRRFTGGSVHPAGRGVLLRTLTHVYFVPMRADQTVAVALAAPPCSLPVTEEEQGEAVTWLAGGDGFVTIGEGRGATVNLTSCPPR